MKIATSIHHGSILANAGSKPNELSGLGCKDVGAEPDLLSYDCLMTKEKAALIHTLMLLLTNTKLQRTFQYTRKNLIVFLPEMPTTWKKQGPHRGHWFFCGFPHIQLSLKLA